MSEYVEESILYAFERDYYNSSEKGLRVESLGKVESEKYFNRLFKFPRAINKIRKEIKTDDILYAYGLDTLYIAYRASRGKKVKIVYEVGDIRKVFAHNNFKGKLFRLLEKHYLNKIDALVITSPKFLTDYFVKIQNYNRNNVFLIENKPDILNSEFSVQDIELNNDDKIVIGYFGRIRCERSLEILTGLIEEDKRFTLKIHGEIPDSYIKKYNLSTNENIELGTSYESYKDLPKLYSNVDISWIAPPYYGKIVNNQNWAIATRFYEGLYFKKAMIDRMDSATTEFINRYKIGITIDLSDINESIKVLKNLDKESIKNMVNNCTNIEESNYKYVNEHLNLYNHLKTDNKKD